MNKHYLKLSFNLPSSIAYYNYLGCDSSQSVTSLIGIQDGSSTKIGSALGDRYYMDNSADIVFGTLCGGGAWDGSHDGLFYFDVDGMISHAGANAGFRSNLISLR